MFALTKSQAAKDLESTPPLTGSDAINQALNEAAMYENAIP